MEGIGVSKMTRKVPPRERKYRNVIREVERYVDECKRRNRPVTLGMIVAAAHDVSGYLDDMDFREGHQMAIAVVFAIADREGLEVPENLCEDNVDYLP
jgi:hypothetical protein